jgi:DNA-binding MarR family transcriptional regulator
VATTKTAKDSDARIEWDIRSLPPCLLLAKLGKDIARQFGEALKPTDLTSVHLGVLHLLKQRPVNQQTLSDAIAVDPSKLVGLLNDLEERSLVVRRRHPMDRRRHIVEISELGRKRLADAERAAAVVEERLLAGLDADQRDQLRALLGHIVGNTPLDSCQLPADPALDDV